MFSALIFDIYELNIFIIMFSLGNRMYLFLFFGFFVLTLSKIKINILDSTRYSKDDR